MQTSINRDSILDPLIVGQRDDNQLTQKFQRKPTVSASNKKYESKS